MFKCGDAANAAIADDCPIVPLLCSICNRSVRFLLLRGMNNELLRCEVFRGRVLARAINRLSAETSVNDDLGMDGDDGVEFMQAFGKRSPLTLTAFPHERYFGPEARRYFHSR